MIPQARVSRRAEFRSVPRPGSLGYRDWVASGATAAAGHLVEFASVLLGI